MREGEKHIVRVMVHGYRSEDNFWKPILSFHYENFWESQPGCQVCEQVPYPLSYLTSPK